MLYSLLNSSFRAKAGLAPTSSLSRPSPTARFDFDLDSLEQRRMADTNDFVQRDMMEVMTSLTQENARLRALLGSSVAGKDTHAASVSKLPGASSRTSTIIEEHDPVAMYAELTAAKAAQAELAREVANLRATQRALVSSATEDQSSEVYLLRSSLAKLASELETEQARAADNDTKIRAEQDQVAMLRSKLDDQRRMIMSLQAAGPRRTSVEALGPPFSSTGRRSSFLDSAPWRKSSLGLNPNSTTVAHAPSNPGLGLAVESPQPNPPSSPSSARTFALQRMAQRRSSASLHAASELMLAEDDRMNRLRELRLGLTTTKIASRRSSLVTGVPDFIATGDFDFDLEHGRQSSSSLRGRHGSAIEDDSSYPPSAPLRAAGRKDSVAVFESWSRRSSSSEFANANYESYLAQQAVLDAGHEDEVADIDDLRLHLQGLRIRLAEAEEGRRASEMCVQALRDFIVKQSSSGEGILGELSLPPMPSDSTTHDADEYCARRSSMPGAKAVVPVASALRSSFSDTSANNTNRKYTSENVADSSSTRRASAVSNSSSSTYLDRPKAARPVGVVFARPVIIDRSVSAPLFSGSFSFAALAPTTAQIQGDTSPTMSSPYSPETETMPTFGVLPHHLSSDSCLSDADESLLFRRPRIHRSPESSAPSLTCSSGASESSGDESRAPSPMVPGDDMGEPVGPCKIVEFAESIGITEVALNAYPLQGGLFATDKPSPTNSNGTVTPIVRLA
ncbi:BQ5605_C024g09917 [Microbotryum silenes-dioicae]|uniref:BQ5605_C024g09917 protein n=1 Tax=Microbotryum silenes-dioicae TaxID=796604 RepID=A0A2X0N881_9BASI|nr:BQ5605_C024g09917 [Microbotryum silenes-dioicae]